jgi:hypothetical protein
MYRSLAKEFNECHQNPVNILIHLVTVFGFYLSLASLFNGTIVLIYGISMGLFIDTFTIQFLTSVFLTGCFYASQYLTLPWLHALVLFAISYVIQDLAHYLTAEPTFQYRYTPTTPGSKIKTWSKFYFQLSLHSYFMLPLVLESATEIRLFEAMLSWFLVLDRMVKLKLNSPTATNNLKIIKKWLDQEGLAKDVTTHYWYSSLPYGIKKSFAQIANEHIIFDKFGNLFPAPLYTTQVLESMNEIYVAAIHTDDATSDNVFYSNHVDGPFMCYPFASVYRAIVAINSNDFIKTVFPAEPCEHILTDGEMWAFDFNREVHRIEQVKEASNQRYF